MSIDVANESDFEVDEKELIDQANFMLKQLHINPAAELSVMLVGGRSCDGYFA
jgi:probable rRNA maturation factor